MWFTLIVDVGRIFYNAGLRSFEARAFLYIIHSDKTAGGLCQRIYSNKITQHFNSSKDYVDKLGLESQLARIFASFPQRPGQLLCLSRFLCIGC